MKIYSLKEREKNYFLIEKYITIMGLVDMHQKSNLFDLFFILG